MLRLSWVLAAVIVGGACRDPRDRDQARDAAESAREEATRARIEADIARLQAERAKEEAQRANAEARIAKEAANTANAQAALAQGAANTAKLDADRAASASVPPVAQPVTLQPPRSRCNESALNCPDRNDTLHGWNLNNAAYHARTAGSFDEGICAARKVIRDGTDDRRLLGAAHFELYAGWKAKGCIANAYEHIAASLKIRPRRGIDWDLTCAACVELATGPCTECEVAE
jgi:hypothetical protein